MDKATELHEEGIRFAQQGDLKRALERFDAALRLNPNESVWQFNRGLACHRLENLSGAISSYVRAAELSPEFFDAWSNLCAALKASGQPEAAVEAGNYAVRLRPNAGGAHLNLGNALKAFGDRSAAEAAYRQALILDPGNSRTRLNLANTLREDGRLAEAIQLLREAVVRSPDFAEAHRDLAFALFISGELLEGWTENEWRWLTGDLIESRRSYRRPLWSGEAVRESTLLLYTEQGFGDAIQFARYVPIAAGLAGRIVIECQPSLARLFESLAGGGKIVMRGEETPPFDCHLPFLSLPRVFNTQLDTIPAGIPYLSASHAEGGKLLPHLNPALANVGLVWAGNSSHLNDSCRSISLECLKPILEIDSACFFSLQVGERAGEALHDKIGGRITNLNSQLTDFAATAAVIEKLDLLISVDTAVAHLGGALGKPVWLLLPYAPDWRWLLGRDDTPWYPTMRLFRQPSHGNWKDVIERIAAELCRFASGARGAFDG